MFRRLEGAVVVVLAGGFNAEVVNGDVPIVVLILLAIVWLFNEARNAVEGRIYGSIGAEDSETASGGSPAI